MLEKKGLVISILNLNATFMKYFFHSLKLFIIKDGNLATHPLVSQLVRLIYLVQGEHMRNKHLEII